MKRLLITALISSSAFASTAVKLDMKLNLNGKEAKPIIITNYGQEAKLTENDDTGNGLEISVLPTAVAKKSAKEQQAINLKFEISEIKAGQKSVIATPVVITHLGKVARISQERDGHHALSLEVVPTETTASK